MLGAATECTCLHTSRLMQRSKLMRQQKYATDGGQPLPNLRDSTIPKVLLRENVAALDRAAFARNSLYRKLNRCPVA
jgi:hypothetical protein